MKALTFLNTKEVGVNSISDPEILHPHDVIVKVTRTAVCGSDMHIYHGRECGLDQGTVMGHEFCGEVVELGKAISKLKKGDKVVSPFSTNCGACYYCNIGLTSRCSNGQLYGWVEKGIGLQGAQAEYVRVPMAESTLVKFESHIPDDFALLTGDILSTGWYAADRAEIKKDGCHAVVGCGPVGLMAVLAAKSMGANLLFAVDPVKERRAEAEKLGAIALKPEEAAAIIKTHSEGRGADSVIEAVGSSAASKLAVDIIRPGGIVSTVGVHTSNTFSFSPIKAYDKNLDYRIGRAPARHYMEKLLFKLAQDKLPVADIITHRMSLEQAAEAYHLFDKKEAGCLKIILTPDA
ncbi:MAG: 2-desacetyl-2-hydroxyethyl bacteriochlorophyllide A dehydrogenase [Limisphaerales bacterium]|jgi:2-desacetyl-2-hydroxyethyl bacteriochlorophyllide A dehydrogenase